MDINNKFDIFNPTDFYSNEILVTGKSLNQNQLKYIYQKELILDLDSKHKEWSKLANN